MGYQAGGREEPLGDFTDPAKIKKNKFQQIRYEILKYFDISSSCYIILDLSKI